MSVATAPTADEARSFIERSSFVRHQRWERVEGVTTPGIHPIDMIFDFGEVEHDLRGKHVLDIGTASGGAAFLWRVDVETAVSDDEVGGVGELPVAQRTFLQARAGFQSSPLREAVSPRFWGHETKESARALYGAAVETLVRCLPVWRIRGETTISVVVCTLNRCASLKRTLEGLAQQTFRRFEVIVVNGPSSDGTAELLSGYPARVGTCSEAHASRARNIGVRMAAGDVCAFLDDDAVPEPDWLEQLAGAYEDPTVAAAGGPVFDVPLGRIDWAICTCTREGAVNTRSEPPAERYLGRGVDPFLYLAGCNMSVRRSALRRVGGFNPELPYPYEDVEVCMRLVDAGACIAWVEAALVRHDRAANSLRDDEQAITDPYLLMFSAAVFIEQSSPTSAPKVLADWLATWKSGPAEQVPEDRRAWFRERVERGIADGVRAGRRPRARARLGRRRRGDFKPYVSTVDDLPGSATSAAG